MFPILQIGPLAIPVPQFSLLISFWIGINLCEKKAVLRKISPDKISTLITIGFIMGVLGARIGYILQTPLLFIQNPINILALNTYMLDGFSGFSVALLAMLVYGYRVQLPFWTSLDVLSIFLATLLIGLAIFDITSGTSKGSITSVPFGIEMWGAKRQPIQFYELISAIILFVFTNNLYHKQFHPGKIFLITIISGSAFILFLEAFHSDSSTIIYGIRTVQIIAWLVMAISIVIFERIRTS